MAYSATLSNMRGLLSDEEHKRILDLFSKAGLSMDHHQFDEDILDKGTKAILKTRDGLLRAAVPKPLGSCVFLNDVSEKELFAALKKHKQLMQDYPRNGEGLDAFVDASDTGYTMNPHDKKEKVEASKTDTGLLKKIDVLNEPSSNGTNGHTNGTNGAKSNGVANGHTNGHSNGVNGKMNGVNGHSVSNGVAQDRH